MQFLPEDLPDEVAVDFEAPLLFDRQLDLLRSDDRHARSQGGQRDCLDRCPLVGVELPPRSSPCHHLRLPLSFCAELADERGRNVELLRDVFHQPPRPLGGGDDLIHLGIAEALQVPLLAQSAGASVDLAQLSELAFAESVWVVSGDGPLQSSP